MNSSRDGAGGAARGAWNFTPPLPIRVSPYFRRPPDLPGILRWLVGGWLPLSERLLILGLSLASWAWFHPELARCREFAPDWIVQIYLRNLVLLTLVAGGLHLYFYTFRLQGDERRYDARPFPTDSSKFTFGAQVGDNMFWSLVSGVAVWSGYEALMMWSLANGHAPMLELPGQLPWLALIVLLLPAWETFYFFLIHRAIHWRPLFRSIHALHHRNTNVGPWSGMSMHPLEHLIYLGTVLVHFLVPSHPLLIIFHLQYYALSAATTHTGYQGILFRGRLLLPLGTFHHQLHHRYFECNYGGLEIPMDLWTGNFHDGTDRAHADFMRRRRARVNS